MSVNNSASEKCQKVSYVIWIAPYNLFYLFWQFVNSIATYLVIMIQFSTARETSDFCSRNKTFFEDFV